MVTSPFMTCLMTISLMELFGRKTKLYAWVQSRLWRLVIKALAILSLISWHSLNFALVSSNHAFIDSEACNDVLAAKRIFNIPLLSICLDKSITIGIPVVFSSPGALLLLVGSRGIRREFRVRESKATKPWGVRYRVWVWVSCG